uniref:Putative DNA polymerase n=1 Tax=viral metagenome TaxID=1070528 RepID=A0A6M3IUM1_9ZZZZ
MFTSYPQCKDCDLWKNVKSIGTATVGSETSTILFIGEANGRDEDACGVPFVGKSGRLLRDALEKFGVIDFAMTNTCRCRPPNNRPPTPKEIAACIHYTEEDRDRMPNLRLMIAVGNIALRALTGKQGITKVSGEEWGYQALDKQLKLMPLMHPSYVLQSQDKELERFYEHVARIPMIVKGTLSGEDDFGTYTVVDTPDKFVELIAFLQNSRIFAYDIETTGLNPRDPDSQVRTIQVSWDLRTAWILPLETIPWTDEQRDTILVELKAIFENKKIGKIGQNIKFDNLWMKTILGIDVRGTIWDTKIVEYLLYGKGSTGLKDMAWRYSRMGGYEKLLGDRPDKVENDETLWKYGGIDADLTFRVYKAQLPKIRKAPSLDHLLHTLLVPASDVLMRMEYHGIRIDTERVHVANQNCEELIAALKRQMSSLMEVKAFEDAEEIEFNPNSHQQIAYILFKICSLDPIKQTEKGHNSTDKEVLERYATDSKLAALLLDYSSYEQMRKTFLSELLSHERNGRIHTTLWLTETTTGRTSSKKPNMQNMPKGDKDILELRKCFVSDEGYILAEADMNQHELRVMAEIAGDQAMMEALSTDIHTATASIIFGIPPEEVTGEQRREAKTVNFGIIYGLTPYGLSQQLGIPESQAELWIYRFFEKYFMTKRYMDATSAFCRRYGYVEALSGRRRYFPSYEEFDVKKIKEAINFPIQSTASDILLYNAIGVDKLLRGRKSFLVLEVHDSLLLNIHRSEISLIDEIRDLMCGYSKQFLNFESELKVDIKVGENWGEMEDYK